MLSLPDQLNEKIAKERALLEELAEILGPGPIKDYLRRDIERKVRELKLKREVVRPG